MKISASISLSWLVLMTSLSFGVNFHFCQGDLKSFALFQEAKPCGHADMPACPMHQTMQSEEDCCDTSAEVVKGQDHPISIVTDLVKTTTLAIVHPAFLLEQPLPVSAKISTPKYLNLKPPLIGKQIRVLVQSFLC